MVSNELKQLLNGESAYSRKRAPESLLLPRIASRIPPDELGFIASAAKTLSSFWISGGWPAIADATAEAIALRHTELSDDLLRQLCNELPQLTLALIELDEAACLRVESIIGGDTASRLKAGLGDATFILREAVSRIFDEHRPPHTSDDLMVFIRDRSEYEGPELQRNLLAYFLPLAPVMHQRWMVPILINVLGAYPDWSVAAAASRVAGLLDQTAIEQLEASLECAEPWANHVHGLLTGNAAGSVFEEVTRALPYDHRFENLLASEAELASLVGFVDTILEEWGGAPPPKMEASRGWEMVDSGDDDLAEESGAEPESPPPSASIPRSMPPASASMPKSMPPPPASSPSPPPAQTVDTSPERMLQAQVFADDDGFTTQVARSFWKNTRHDVRLWIGPEKRGAIKADKTLAEPTPDAEELQKGSMEIVITLAHGSDLQSKTVDLPINRAQRSDIAVFSLNVGEKYVSADVWLQHKGRILQYFELNGPTHDDPEDSISLSFQSAIRGIPVDSSGGNFEMAMVKKDDKYIVFGPRGAERTEVSLQGSGDFIESINERLFKTTIKLVRSSADHKGTSWVGDDNGEAMELLLEMARWGNVLHDTLKKEGALERISENIQFVNLDETDIVPIEYVYDRGFPGAGATLCEGFREAEDWNEIFAVGKCTCSNQPGVMSDTLCPMGFWSLSKIIERQTRPRDTASAQTTTGFSEPSATSPGVPLARHAVLAAAPNVKSEDVDSIKSTLEESYPNRHKLVTDWKQWEEEIEDESPKLLILLPHHGKATGGFPDFLEIGSAGETQGAKLYTGLLSENYVSKKLDEPGPIVLLLGCQTAQADQLPYHTFARDFLANRASIVVATQATVLGQHVAPVASEFIRQLLATTPGDGSFGTIMRDVRRKMFASGYLVSLALISFGDSDWKLANNTTGENDVSH